MHPEFSDIPTRGCASVIDDAMVVRAASPPSSEMEISVYCVEKILNYSFKNKRLLEEALTHSSYPGAASYQRLEFVGDAALGLAFSNYIFLVYPRLDPGQLSLIRSANISTEKLARVAVRHGLYRFMRHNAASALDDKVKEFAEAVSQEEDNAAVYGGSMKAPKVLADIVESIAAAIYVDVDFDLQKLWVIIRGLMEPIITLEDLKQKPQPVTLLFELCQKQGKQVDIKYWRKKDKNIASVYVDGEFVASSSSEQKEIAKLNAAREALHKLLQFMPVDNGGMIEIYNDVDGKLEIGAKQKLHEICSKKKWPKPTYQTEKDEGPSHDKKFICSVKIPTADGTLYITGAEKSRVRDAENSAAAMMIGALYESNYI
ncbi:ribonuclease 3-like protein 2 [Mangifera indica]|uniref:ribonuclease 3-like protein 2 n=1 Tax=Mangifera indica TaxID=29780 RepID=UPI001CFBF138|nr:ribonuclease 3-like protein 2 [Mangifera indica]